MADRAATIGLNLLYLVPEQTGGMDTYARRLVPALVAARADARWVAFLPREARAVSFGPGVDHVRTTVTARSRARRILAEQVLLPRLVRRHRIELLHSLASSAPARAPAVQVVTIHDVNYATAPQAHTAAMRAGQRVIVPAAARAAERVIAVSRAARDALVAELRLHLAKVDVVPNGGGLAPGPATPEAELRARLGLGDAPLVLSVSARRPHKNLERLVAAMARLRAAPAPLLVLPGYATPFDAHLARAAAAAGVADRVRMLDWLADPDLEGLYRSAAVFAFPSLAEGFGLPVLEAMERGLPVACARASALPEVAGEAASYFDPRDVGDIARALDAVLADRAEAARLSEAGRRRARMFTWERAARGTLASYDQAVRDARR
jgi:glycosyltransferase involved in cell wall biosynthesis